MHYNEKGQEVPDTTPVEAPIHFSRPLTLAQQMQRMIRTELSKQAVDDGQESFEEADDFDVDEDPDPLSQYEQIIGVAPNDNQFGPAPGLDDAPTLDDNPPPSPAPEPPATPLAKTKKTAPSPSPAVPSGDSL